MKWTRFSVNKMVGYTAPRSDRTYVKTPTTIEYQASQAGKTKRMRNLLLGGGILALLALPVANELRKPQVRNDLAQKISDAYHQEMEVTNIGGQNYEVKIDGKTIKLTPYSAKDGDALIRVMQKLDGYKTEFDPATLYSLEQAFSAVKQNKSSIEALLPGQSAKIEFKEMDTSMKRESTYLVPYSIKNN